MHKIITLVHFNKILPILIKKQNNFNNIFQQFKFNQLMTIYHKCNQIQNNYNKKLIQYNKKYWI